LKQRALLLHGGNLRQLSGLRLLEAGPAEHRPALRGTKWNSRLLAACRALGARLSTNARPTVCTLSLALLAALGVIFKLFIVKEELLSGGEDELIATVNAFEDSILKFHGRLPREGK
jgi:hypothetical protein